MSKKPTSTFSKITKVVIWVMLIAMVGGSIFGALASLGII
ncbi:DUF4044 domain-containing protein [Vagococcus carniphilus]|uniref:DUF4044 domain-containing protein n=1 Tax=Vagococcus carniphilus TaxID=218144 RepID=A0A430B9D5_9ENTE|nr:DUF4044 domain-containing protein [Vagococcus carniphilus]QNN73610.1 DUF4044 domain-containing protein [Vagococcus carniphilus]RSU16868.1 DUF4044 domain-containing protein [Vagococcus carniphilus]